MLKRPFSIVRQYFCQMLDNTLAKRWAILLPKRYQKKNQSILLLSDIIFLLQFTL